jgi:hypothetical protein
MVGRIGAPFAMSPCRSRVPGSAETKVDLLHSLSGHRFGDLGKAHRAEQGSETPKPGGAVSDRRKLMANIY